MSGNRHSYMSTYRPELKFKNEQEFKTWWMESQRGTYPPPKAFFEIENEEKEPGFPDTLLINAENRALFFEFKMAYKSGRFTMEPTQPRFFKNHPNLSIFVVVWDAEKSMEYVIGADTIADKVLEKSSLTLNVRKMD